MSLPAQSKQVAIAALAAVLAIGAFRIVGCTPPPPPITSSGKGKLSGAERCGKLLNSAFDVLQPDRLGIDSGVNTAVGLLNDWISTCGSKNDAGLTPENRSILEKHLPKEYLQRVVDERFDSRDGTHVRDCLLWKKTIHFAIQTAENDRARIVELFNYVIRNIALEKPGENALPLTPFEIALFGRGSAADRAWLFADILRQIRIDVVILRPRGKGPSQSDQPGSGESAWLVAALLDNDVYLFEPRLGTPIPSRKKNDKSATVQSPATLAEAIEDEQVLRQLDAGADHPYPLSSADLKNLRVEVIGNTSLWAPRMRALEQSLAGERSVILHDSLEDNQTGPGLLSRVADYGANRWGRDDVGVWRYPEDNLHGFDNLDQKQVERFSQLMEPFAFPLEVQKNQAGQFVLGLPQRHQLRIRIKQLMGGSGDVVGDSRHTVIANFLAQVGAMQLPPNVRLPPEVKRMQDRALEDGQFWIGVCQFGNGEYKAASDYFGVYLAQHGPDGHWSPHCRFLRAWSLAEAGRFQEAAQDLKAAPATDPQADGYPLYVRRWTQAGEASQKAPESASQSTPEKPKESASQKPAADSPEKTNANTPKTNANTPKTNANTPKTNANTPEKPKE